MPSSKEVRARQNRQKERIAAQRADRQRIKTRRTVIGIAVGLVVFVGAVAAVLAVSLHNSGGKKASPPPTTSPTTAALVNSKPCVGLKDPLPKGSPKFTVPVGPAPTKLTWRDLKTGTGPVIPQNAKVSTNYVGVACSTGKIFDSSYKRNKPLEADLSGSIIDGWKQGIPGMRVGGVRVLAIPSSLAYKETGVTGTGIGPNEALYFLVAPVKLG
jgi:peptidylprolyl isomerase